MKTFSEFIAWEKLTQDVIDFKKVYVDIADDLVAGLVLSVLVYWYLPSKNSDRDKLRVRHEGNLWIASRYKDWYERARLTESQAERAIRILVEKGIVIKDVFKFNGEPTVHLRIDQDNFISALNKANSVETDPISVVTENEICQNRSPVTEITTKTTTTINGLQKNSKPMTTLEPCNEDGIPDSWIEKSNSKKKRFIAPEVKAFAEMFSELTGVKQPILVTSKDYSAYAETWKKPIELMLHQVDNDLEKAYPILERTIAYHVDHKLQKGLPVSIHKTFCDEVANEHIGKGSRRMAKDADGNWREV